LPLSRDDLDKSGDQPAIRKGVLVSYPALPDITTARLYKSWMPYIRGFKTVLGGLAACRLLFEEQSMKYDDELFLLLITVFVILGVALLLALLF
jgi:hypothetical protein